MKSTPPIPSLDQMIETISGCFTEEGARRIVSLKPDRKLQARVDQLSRKCSDGTLTPEEHDEYHRYVSFGTFVTMLKSKARLQLANTGKA